jgi:hypothetical protein
LEGIGVPEFFDVHRAMTVDEPHDEKIQIDGALWHGTPVDGRHSSFAAGHEIADDRLRALLMDPKAKLSNRLYRFQISTNGRVGIPFRARIEGTNRLVIHTYSPRRSDFDRWIEIDISR